MTGNWLHMGTKKTQGPIVLRHCFSAVLPFQLYTKRTPEKAPFSGRHLAVIGVSP